MTRILFIARYRDASMFRKVELLAQAPDMVIRFIVPQKWRDELLQVEQQTVVTTGNLQRLALSMVGSPSDPHRAFYRTVEFGVSAFKPDIIHAEEEPDSLAALQIALARATFAPKAKLILHTWQNIDRPMSAFAGLVRRVTLRAADMIFCANQEAIDLLHKLGYRCPTPPVPALGVDTSLFQPCSIEPKEAIFRIGYVGRLDVNKGLATLVEAFAQLRTNSSAQKRRIQLCFIGNGPYEKELRLLVQGAGISDDVTFVAAMPPVALVNEFCRLSVLVLPSRTTPVWKEQFGRVLTEAMACKIPVIGSNSGAIPEVIGNAGFVFPEGNAEALAGYLYQLWDSPILCQELAEKGYLRVSQNYVQEQIAAETLKWYRSL